MSACVYEWTLFSSPHNFPLFLNRYFLVMGSFMYFPLFELSLFQFPTRLICRCVRPSSKQTHINKRTHGFVFCGFASLTKTIISCLFSDGVKSWRLCVMGDSLCMCDLVSHFIMYCDLRLFYHVLFVLLCIIFVYVLFTLLPLLYYYFKHFSLYQSLSVCLLFLCMFISLCVVVLTVVLPFISYVSLLWMLLLRIVYF